MIIQYGKQKNQPIQLSSIDTFYRPVPKEITFIFSSGRSQVWVFQSEQECSQVYGIIIRNQGARLDCNI